MVITVTCIKDGRVDGYGRPLVSGQQYVLDSQLARSLWQSGHVSVPGGQNAFDDDSTPRGSSVGLQSFFDSSGNQYTNVSALNLDYPASVRAGATAIVGGKLYVSDGSTWNIIKLATPQSETGRYVFGPGLGVTPTVTPAAGCTIDSSGVEVYDGAEVFSVTMTVISASNRYAEIILPVFPSIAGETSVVEFYADHLGGGVSIDLYLGDDTFTKNAKFSRTILSANLSDPYYHLGRMSLTCNSADFTKTGYTTNTGDMPWTSAKLKFTIPNGQTSTFKLRSIKVGAASRKGRICVVADGGYADWFSAGAPLLELYGINTTASIIADKVGTSTFVTLPELAEYVRRGNECVAHGVTGGGLNLAVAFATDAERVADMVANRDYLVSNGLATARSAKCYVWPQGVYTATAGDLSLVRAAQEAGFEFARGAIAKTANFLHFRELSSDAPIRMFPPVIGHSYAGAFSTADDATETTNINNIVGYIQAAGAARADIFLMLHRVSAKGEATTTTTIEMDRLRTLAAAIQAEVAAGRLESVLMSDFLAA